MTCRCANGDAAAAEPLRCAAHLMHIAGPVTGKLGSIDGGYLRHTMGSGGPHWQAIVLLVSLRVPGLARPFAFVKGKVRSGGNDVDIVVHLFDRHFFST